MKDIPTYIEDWRNKAPWSYDYQIQQDLIISRALVSLYSDDFIRENLAFRGGTALNKLFFKPSARYSEDIDLVLIHKKSSSDIMNHINEALNWLGKPSKIDKTSRSLKLFFQYLDLDNIKRKLKIEINVTEYFNLYGYMYHKFAVKDSWFSGEAILTTYNINELMGTKLRALHQRSKGRDLFDIYLAIKMDLIDCKIVVDAFLKYCEHDGHKISRAIFEKTFKLKLEDSEFSEDILSLLPKSTPWSYDKAVQMVRENIIALLPGKPFKTDAS